MLINTHCVIWLISLPILYFFILSLCRKYNYCQNITLTNSSTDKLITHLYISFICVTYISISGIILYFKYSDLVFNKYIIFERNELIENHILIPMLVYQFWNTVISLLHKDLYSIYFILHHVFVFILGIFILWIPLFQYIIIYFFGLNEITNVFLSLIEIKEYDKRFEKYTQFNFIINIIFILLYFIFRIVIWIYANYQFILMNIIHKEILFSKYKIIIFILITGNIFLTFLQFYWGFLIYNKVVKKIKGE